MAMAGIAGRDRAEPPTSTERVTITAGAAAGAGAGLGGGGDGREGGACGACGVVGERCTVAREPPGAGSFVPADSGFAAPSFGDFENKLIALNQRITVLRSSSTERDRAVSLQCERRAHPPARCYRDTSRFMRAMGIGFVAWLAACSSHDPKRPPELGNCTPSADVTCSPPVTGGGGVGQTSIPPDSSAPSNSDAMSSDAATCGVAVPLLMPTNVYCAPCIETSCCDSAQACSQSMSCQMTMQCTLACGQGDQFCVTGCENTPDPTAYTDFANCLSRFCSPQCPSLRQ
jgi:hypothetical protein